MNPMVMRCGAVAVWIMLGAAVGTCATRTCTVSGNWSNAAIWSGSAVPTLSDDVIIRGGATVTLDMNAGCQTLKIGSNVVVVDGGILLMPSTSYTLDVQGDVTLGSNSAGILSMVNGFLTVRGSMIINANGSLLATGGSVWYAATAPAMVAGATYNKLNIVSGDLTADGIITTKSEFRVNAAATFHSQAYGLHVEGDFVSLGTFDAGTGSVELEGAAAKTITTSSHFHHLYFDGTGTTTALNGFTVDLDLSIYTDATFDAGHYVINVGRDWQCFGVLVPGTSTVKLTATSVQRLDGATTFHHLVLTGGGSKGQYGNVTVEGNLTVDAGTEFAGNGFQLHLKGVFTLDGTFSVNPTGRTYFDGAGNQDIPAGLLLNDLILGGGGTKTALGDLVINRDLTIDPGATFDAGSTTAIDTVKGDWTNDGSFLPHGGLVVLKSPSTQFLKGTTTFSNLTFIGAGTKFVRADLTVNADFTIGAVATVEMDTSALTLKGDWVANGSFDAGTGTVTLNGAGAQSLTGATTFNNLILGGNNVKTALNPLTINGDLTIRAGVTFDPGSVTHNIKGDFDNNGVFSAAAGTLIFNGAAPQVISGSSRFANITVDNDSGARIVSTLGDTLHGTLNFVAGCLKLGAGNLILQPAASVIGAGVGHCIVTNGLRTLRRRIQGGVVGDMFTFPVAPTTTSYNPLTIQLRQDASEPSETFNVRVEVLTGSSPGFGTFDSSAFVRRVWTIDETTPGGNRANLTFQWDPADDGANIGVNPSNPVALAAYLYDSATYGLADDAVGPAYLTGPIIAATDGFQIVGFGSVMVGNPAALPITLASFAGVELPGIGVRLDWRTLSEIGNLGFYLQRKTPADSLWTELAGSFVPGNGTTAVPHDYAFTDSTARGGQWSYRLRQVDSNGGSFYSGAVTVSVTTSASGGVQPLAFGLEQNYPNPFNPVTTIQFDLPSPQQVTLMLYDLLGREVATILSGAMESGRHTVRVDASRLASGTYLYRLTTSVATATKKLIVLR